MSWPTERLDELCDIQIGRTPSRADNRFWDGGTHPWASIADISRDRDLTTTKECITDQALSATKIKVVPEGTVLMSFKLSIGKVAIARIDTCTNEAIAALSIKSPKSLDRDYLARALESLNFDDAGDRAAKGKTLNKKSLAKLEIPLPPLGEQKRIAAILDKADELRRKRQCAIDRLNQLGQAIFHEMFGSEAVQPDEWEKADLADVVRKGDKINYGVVQPGKDVEHGVPLVRVADLLNPVINPAHVKQIDPEIEARYSRSRLVGDEILLGCVGSIGSVNLAHSGLKGANIARAVARIPVDENKAERIFIAEVVRSPLVQRYFASETRTVAQPTLNIGLIKAAPIFLPPLKLQKEFVAKLKLVEQSLEGLDRACVTSDRLFSSLQQSAFKGEL